MFSGIVLHGSSKERLQAWAHCEDRSEIFDTASCLEQYWRSPHLWEEYAADPMYRRSLAQTWWGPKLCQNMPTTWWNLDKNAQNVSKPMSFTVQSMEFFSVDKVDCNRATHSSPGRMPHVRWCLGTNLETTWKIRIQNLPCSVWIFLKLSETFSRLASSTAQWFQRQWTLLGPRIRVRCKLHEDHEVATSYILSVIVTMLSTT